MSSFVVTKRVEAPPETVFDVATDLAHAAEHVRGIERIEMLTPGPVGVGTKWRETRQMMGREATETLEVKAFDRPRKYVVGCESCGCYFESEFNFVPSGNGTDVTLDVHTKALTLIAKIISPIGSLMTGKTMRKLLDGDLTDVKRVAESRAGTPVAP
jgi:carbon monoxide dehydrogenase subunit G